MFILPKWASGLRCLTALLGKVGTRLSLRTHAIVKCKHQCQRGLMNISATINALKLIVKPHLCLPHATVSTFDQIPIPFSKILTAANRGETPDIKFIVLDKDNCFAKPKENIIYEPYRVSALPMTIVTVLYQLYNVALPNTDLCRTIFNAFERHIQHRTF